MCQLCLLVINFWILFPFQLNVSVRNVDFLSEVVIKGCSEKYMTNKRHHNRWMQTVADEYPMSSNEEYYNQGFIIMLPDICEYASLYALFVWIRHMRRIKYNFVRNETLDRSSSHYRCHQSLRRLRTYFTCHIIWYIDNHHSAIRQ